MPGYAPLYLIWGISGWRGHRASDPRASRRPPVTLGGADARFALSHLVLVARFLPGLSAAIPRGVAAWMRTTGCRECRR